MANEQHAFIHRDKIPSVMQWQEAIRAAGYDLQLSSDLNVLEHEGFLPCKLLGQDAGVEMYYAPASEIIEDPADLEDLADDRDGCISFRWGGSFQEAACAMILSFGLASACEAVVSYKGEEPYQDLAALRKDTDDMIREATKRR